MKRKIYCGVYVDYCCHASLFSQLGGGVINVVINLNTTINLYLHFFQTVARAYVLTYVYFNIMVTHQYGGCYEILILFLCIHREVTVPSYKNKSALRIPMEITLVEYSFYKF